jgi:hypothetical protein
MPSVVESNLAATIVAVPSWTANVANRLPLHWK